MEDPTLKLIFSWADAQTKPTQPSLGKLRVKRSKAIAAGADAVALWSLWEQLELADGVLYRKWLVEKTNSTIRQFMVPTSLRDHVLDPLHDSKISGGHFAFQKTLDRARQQFWWPKMRKDIELKCESCLVCQARSTAGKKRRAPLQTIDVGIRFNKIAADILGPVTKTKPTGYKYILVLADFFTKYVVSVPLQSTTAEAVAKALVEHWILLFCTPDSVHTVQGTNFCSEMILELCRLLAIDKTRTSAYHPLGNGMVQRHNRVIADMISKYCSGNPHTWDEMLSYLSFVYNTIVHRTTGHTPFSLVFGQECRYRIDLFLPKAPGQEIRKYEFTRWLEEQFTEAHMNARETLSCNQERQKDIYQKDVFGDAYKAGDKVWLFAPHQAKSRKFFLPWDGPYTILEKIWTFTTNCEKPQHWKMADSTL